MSRHIGNVDLLVEGDTAYVTVVDAQRLAEEAHGLAWEEANKRLREQDKRICDLVIESNGFNSKWCSAESQLESAQLRNSRADEAMRDYEKTISEQCKRISELEGCRDWQAVEIEKLKARELQVATDPKLRAAIRRNAAKPKAIKV